MAISLQKGQKIDLSKNGTQLNYLMVGLGWKQAAAKKGFFSAFSGKTDVDIDASVLMLGADGRLPGKDYVIYFNNKRGPQDCITHCGDNLVGGTMGGMEDSEQILINLSAVPQNVERLVFVVNIYDCVARRQHFGMVRDAYIRIVDKQNGETLASYNLTEDYVDKTTMTVGEIYRRNGAWKFAAVGKASRESGLSEIIAKYR